MDRHEIQEIVAELDDPTELLTNLMYEVIYAVEVGDFSGIESIIDDFHELAEIRESDMESATTRNYFSENEDF